MAIKAKAALWEGPVVPRTLYRFLGGKFHPDLEKDIDSRDFEGIYIDDFWSPVELKDDHMDPEVCVNTRISQESYEGDELKLIESARKFKSFTKKLQAHYEDVQSDVELSVSSLSKELPEAESSDLCVTVMKDKRKILFCCRKVILDATESPTVWLVGELSNLLDTLPSKVLKTTVE